MPTGNHSEPVLPSRRPVARRPPYAETDSSDTESESDDDRLAPANRPTDPASPPTSPVPGPSVPRSPHNNAHHILMSLLGSSSGEKTNPQLEVSDGLGDDDLDDPLAIAVPVKRGRGSRGRGNKRRRY